ncbi:MAG: hypothetical protein DMG53_01070 [Acidobacteria bacterium]|nr:MAG: hypothetical protein DMG53_01070 [Acidobacteriota bacterium]
MAPPAMSGIEWVIEAFGCSAQSLRDTAVLQELFHRIIREMRLRPVEETRQLFCADSVAVRRLERPYQSHWKQVASD